MDDPVLIQRILEGDELAGSMLVSLYGPRLASYARAMAGDLSDADREVICENAVEKAVRKMDLYDPERASLYWWMRGFVRSEVSSWRRSMERLEPFDPEKAEDQASPPLEMSADAQEAARELAQAISELTRTDQLIIGLRDVEELSYAEIAARLGDVSEEACRKRHSRALARLKELARERPVLVRYLEGGQ